MSLFHLTQRVANDKRKCTARSVVLTYQTQSRDEFKRLSALLHELGFEPAEGWNDELSRGAPFKAATGVLELVDGEAPCEAEILVEVSDVAAIAEVARRHGFEVSEPMATHWNSAVVIAELGALRVGFFQFENASEEAA